MTLASLAVDFRPSHYFPFLKCYQVHENMSFVSIFFMPVRRCRGRRHDRLGLDSHVDPGATQGRTSELAVGETITNVLRLPKCATLPIKTRVVAAEARSYAFPIRVHSALLRKPGEATLLFF